MFPLLRTLPLLLAAVTAFAADANRLAYLDDSSPFWPSPESPKFVTPQWIGEPGVDAVVIIAIDDMRQDLAKYETFLRPVLERLKKIDGRAPVSIMSNSVAAADPQLQSWLKEGVSLEVHTLTHPCPCLGKASFDEAVRTYQGGVDLLASVPGNKPVAFRMPCCDSINSVTPRFFTEIFNVPSAAGNWLAIDSSVFTRLPDERFKKYFPEVLKQPTKVTFENYSGYIENYPYPYVIDRLCWEFPCMVPSDWEAFNAVGPKSDTMLQDLKAALDGVVKAQGVFTTVLHPHGWSAPEQWVALIDFTEKTYGKRVKFLTFREALERIEKNALGDYSLRAPGNGAGGDRGVRVLDVDADGYMDIVIGGREEQVTRVWRPAEKRWHETKTPVVIASEAKTSGQVPMNVRFGVFHESGAAAMVVKSHFIGAWTWEGDAWKETPALLAGLPEDFTTGKMGHDAGVRFRDFDRDGICELLANSTIFSWNSKTTKWEPANFKLPDAIAVVDEQGRDNGLRFADLNGDGYEDILQSNDAGYSIHLWAANVRADLGWKRGWSHLIAQGPASADVQNAKVLPFVKDGRNYGGWFHKDLAVWQNEDTFQLEAYTFRRSFKDLIAFDVPAPKSPEASLAAMKPRPGFRVELVAAEPLVVDPIAFDWDARGRLWVVEMRDYPLGMDGKGAPGGVIKVLEDTDHDGKYDKATAFMEGLTCPTGVFPWRNGAIVCAAPDLIYAEDTDNDGRADKQRVLFTGFKQGNQQHLINGFDWGLDGWIYGANGDSGGDVKSLQTGAEVNISGRDFRFRPDTGEFEAESGGTQYNRRRDDWGNWFGNNNSVWLWNYTLDDRYLRRNPKLAVKTTKQYMATYANASRVFPVSKLPIRFNQPQSLGHVTSGCSPTPYRDVLFGPEFADSVFISEPVHNLIHREIVIPEGATFRSERAADEKDREFLASADPWFRPTMLKSGPDGALYIADFYRFVLEHPEWIAPETQSRLDLRAGSDKGRIYRVVPEGAQPRHIPNLERLDNAGLVAAMNDENGWQRDTVQRLLIERKATDSVLELQKLAATAKSDKVRVQTLATLSTLEAADAPTIRTALRDASPKVRVQALRSSEALAGKAPELIEELAACAEDPEFTVRRQLALTLGFFDHDRARATLARLAERESDLPLMKIAVLSSLKPESPLFVKLNSAPAASGVKVPTVPKPTTADRAKVIGRYAQVEKLEGSAERGHQLFTQQCAICHRLRGEGVEVGPELGMVSNKPVDWLLTAIFDPNAAIEPRYQVHAVKLRAGTEMNGIITGETANNITLKLPGGSELPVLRDDIAQQKPTGRSLMPEGLEAVLTPQGVADVIAWLRSK